MTPTTTPDIWMRTVLVWKQLDCMEVEVIFCFGERLVQGRGSRRQGTPGDGESDVSRCINESFGGVQVQLQPVPE